MIPFRVYIIPKWFSQPELDILDDLTANNSAVLASLGGPPRFPGEMAGVVQDSQDGDEELRRRGRQGGFEEEEEEEEEHYGVERRYSEHRRGSVRYR